MARTWDEFEKFKNASKYLPEMGDGKTMGTQAATALSRLIYRWFNDGDVFASNGWHKWGNDLSGSANWLYHYIPETKSILKRVRKIYNADYANEFYADLLYDLACVVDPLIPELDAKPRIGDAYREKGPFRHS